MEKELLQYEKINWNKMALFWEVTDFCNARCIMCGAHRKKKYPHNTPEKFTTLEEFKKILSHILSSPFKPGAIVYSWLGESLLNPAFLDMLSWAERMGISNQQFNTNGLALTTQVIDRLLTLKSLKRIHFSLDAATPKTFKIIKGQGGFRKIEENLKYLILKRKELNSKLDLVFAFIVQPQNYKEASLFLQWAQELLKNSGRDYLLSCDVVHEHGKDVILFSRLLTYNQAASNKLHKKICYQLGILKEKNLSLESPQPVIQTEQVLEAEDPSRPPCAALWFMPNIDSRGNLTICCHDLDLEMKLGNLLQESFYNLWFQGKIETYRKIHLQREFHKLPLCKNCTGIEHFNFKDVFIS